MVAKIYALARKFQDQSPKDTWEDLFDYLNRIGFRQCYSNEDELLQCFSKYMHQYRMYRNTGLTKERLLEILLRGRDIYLEFLCNYNDETLVEAWHRTRELLQELEISTSPVMITKLLMGFGGKTPAYDSQFLITISSNPTFLQYGINHFVELLQDSGLEELKTHGDENPIPWQRVLDMAFWYASRPGHEEFLI